MPEDSQLAGIVPLKLLLEALKMRISKKRACPAGLLGSPPLPHQERAGFNPSSTCPHLSQLHRHHLSRPSFVGLPHPCNTSGVQFCAHALLRT